MYYLVGPLSDMLFIWTGHLFLYCPVRPLSIEGHYLLGHIIMSVTYLKYKKMKSDISRATIDTEKPT